MSMLLSILTVYPSSVFFPSISTSISGIISLPEYSYSLLLKTVIDKQLSETAEGPFT